jgi:hypothetical protein
MIKSGAFVPSVGTECPGLISHGVFSPSDGTCGSICFHKCCRRLTNANSAQGAPSSDSMRSLTRGARGQPLWLDGASHAGRSVGRIQVVGPPVLIGALHQSTLLIHSWTTIVQGSDNEWVAHS